MFQTLIPTYHYIDRADARYARAMQFEKDYAATLSAAWSIDTAVDRYLNDADEDSAELMHLLGIDEDYEAERQRKIQKLIDSNLTKGSFKDRYVSPFPKWSESNP